MGIIAVSVCALSLAPAASAEPEGVHISVSADVDNSGVTVRGSVRSTSGVAVPGIPVALSLGTTNQSVMTSGDGSFSHRFPRPAAGTYTAHAAWSGDSHYSSNSGSTTVVVPALSKTGTTVTVAIDPKEASPGQVISITGKLVSGNNPIAAAVVSLTSDFGDVDGMSVTGADGAFSAMMSIPTGNRFPSSFTVTVAYGGDAVYAASNAKASGSVKAVPTPVAEPTDSADSDETLDADTSSTNPNGPLSAGPTRSSGAASGSGSGTGGDGRMMIVEIVFLAVAFVAVATLLVLAIVSHGHKALARGERRGFGSDFGKERVSIP